MSGDVGTLLRAHPLGALALKLAHQPQQPRPDHDGDSGEHDSDRNEGVHEHAELPLTCQEQHQPQRDQRRASDDPGHDGRHRPLPRLGLAPDDRRTHGHDRERPHGPTGDANEPVHQHHDADPEQRQGKEKTRRRAPACLVDRLVAHPVACGVLKARRARRVGHPYWRHDPEAGVQDDPESAEQGEQHHHDAHSRHRQLQLCAQAGTDSGDDSSPLRTPQPRRVEDVAHGWIVTRPALVAPQGRTLSRP